MDTISHDFFLILPEVELALFGLAILVFDFMLGVRDKTGNALFAMMGVFFSGVSLYRLHHELGADPVGGFTSSIVVDPFFEFFGMIFLIALALVILLSVRYLQIENEHHGEYYALLLFATVGMMFMASGYDLIVMFLGLETMAISFYILAGFLRGQRRSNEAGVKYLLLGAFSSGLLAYGFSLLYGISAMADVRGPMGMPLMLPRTNIDVLRSALEQGLDGPGKLLVFLAIATVSAGLLGATIFMALIDIITHQQLGYFFYPNWNAAAFLLLAVPLACVFSVEMSVIVSSRVSDVRTASQFGGLMVIPFAALYVLGEINVVPLTANTMLIVSAVLLPVNILLFFVSRATFRRDQILTEWK